MPDLALGDISLTRVVETDTPHMPATVAFPDWDEAAIGRHRDWLVPRHLTHDGKVRFVIQSFLVKTPHHTILVDSCGGNGKERARGSHFHRRDWPFLQTLAACGARPEDIDFVLCTHMHVDHVGWNTRLENGRWVPTFPNARYIFARTEWEHWQAEAARTHLPRTGDYIADSVLPIVEAKRAVLVEMDHQIEDGVWLEPLSGHSPGMVGLHLKPHAGAAAPAAAEAVLCGDAMHSIVQVVLPDWSTNFCTDQAAARATRRRFLERNADRDVLVYPAHFPDPTGGRVESAADGFRFRFLGE